MSESNTLNIQLPKEDSDRLTQEAKRRQIDRTTLAQILLQKSLANLDFESLENLYNFLQKPEVLDFLEKHPFLIPLLLEVHTQIRQHFPDAPLFLEYVPDPEIDHPHLVVYIATNLETEAALDRMDLLDDWWVEVPNRGKGKMFFNLDSLE
ncbi:hypothetical protein [Floridanema evergladense]|uniref:Uncharacterized protein n=1 Tax=Floridaenema evergladense BLCC-F167 TaxID=3153639 RepID=A0ABV4WNL4_9CYAN